MTTSLTDVLGTISTVTGVIRPFVPTGSPADLALTLAERGLDIAQRLDAGDQKAKADAEHWLITVRDWNASSAELDAARARYGDKS